MAGPFVVTMPRSIASFATWTPIGLCSSWCYSPWHARMCTGRSCPGAMHRVPSPRGAHDRNACYLTRSAGRMHVRPGVRTCLLVARYRNDRSVEHRRRQEIIYLGENKQGDIMHHMSGTRPVHGGRAREHRSCDVAVGLMC